MALSISRLVRLARCRWQEGSIGSYLILIVVNSTRSGISKTSSSLIFMNMLLIVSFALSWSLAITLPLKANADVYLRDPLNYGDVDGRRTKVIPQPLEGHQNTHFQMLPFVMVYKEFT